MQRYQKICSTLRYSSQNGQNLHEGSGVQRRSYKRHDFLTWKTGKKEQIEKQLLQALTILKKIFGENLSTNISCRLSKLKRSNKVINL